MSTGAYALILHSLCMLSANHSMTHPPATVAVLGAGLMGRLLALALAQSGQRVAIYEAAPENTATSAAHVAAAMLAPLAESAVTEMNVVRMGRYALGRWPALLSSLQKPVFFQQEGTLIVWHRQDAAQAALFKNQLSATTQALADLPQARTLDAVAIGALEPELGQRFAQGLFLPEEGQLDNRQLLDALAHELYTLGVAWHWNSPRSGHDFQPGQTGQPDWVFDCRGVGAQPQWSGLRGVRGEVVRLHAPEVTLQRPVRLLHPRYPLYIAPKDDHVFVIGATEIESPDTSPASVRSVLELLGAAYSVHSGFAEARVLEIATQCRPALLNNLPALRWLAPRVLQINGLYRHGFLIAPALLDTAMELFHTGHSPLAQSLEVPVLDDVAAAAAN